MNSSDLVQAETHSRILRFLFASVGGVDPSFLTAAEREALGELEEAGVVRRSPAGPFVANEAYPQLQRLQKELLEAPRAEGKLEEAAAEIERLRHQQRESQTLFAFIQRVSGAILRSNSVGEVFHLSFAELASALDFTVGVGVMLEQNLDLYVMTNAAFDRTLDERLTGEVRAALHSLIPLSFASTDVVIQGDFADLPERAAGSDPLAWRTQAILRHDNRAAGILALFRGTEAFSEEETRMLEVLSGQVSIVLDKIRAQEQIQKLADSDELTGIWNRRYLKQRLPGEIDRARVYDVPLSMLMLDVDDFKGINDTFGHPMGDVVLSEICGTVKGTLRVPDFMARIGGDEFAVVLPHTDLWGARSVADRIVQRVRALDHIVAEDGEKIRCSVSVGVATFVPPDMTANDLLQRADEQLLLSKKSGKNRTSW